jgi:hypothetical protein
MVKESMDPVFSIGLMAMIRKKVPIFKNKHDDGAPSRSEILHWNQAQLIISHTCQLTDNQKIYSLLHIYLAFEGMAWKASTFHRDESKSYFFIF